MRGLVVSVAAWVFLGGTVLIGLAAVPALNRRWPKLLLVGFLVAIGSFAIVGLATLIPDG